MRAFWLGLSYIWGAIGLGLLGGDILRWLEEGDFGLRSLGAVLSPAMLNWFPLDPSGLILSQSAALMVLGLAVISWLLSRIGSRRQRRIFG